MCNIKSIRLGVQSLGILKVLLAFYMFGIGCTFCGSTQLQQGYGLAFVGYGAELIIMGMISGVVVVPHLYANKRHNRFLLVVCCFFDFIVLITVSAVSSTLTSYIPPVFPKDLQLDCLKNIPTLHTPKECADFLTNDRTAGFRLYWEGYYTNRAKPESFQVLATIQGAVCCGFFAPLNCIPNKKPFPTTYSQMGILPSLLSQQVSCGPVEGYYPQTESCLDYYKSAAVVPIIGGCRYDMGVGFCMKNDVREESIGCASAVEDYIGSTVAPHAAFLLLSAFINLIAMLYECCMLWKRREDDIFPIVADNIAVS